MFLMMSSRIENGEIKGRMVILVILMVWLLIGMAGEEEREVELLLVVLILVVLGLIRMIWKRGALRGGAEGIGRINVSHKSDLSMVSLKDIVPAATNTINTQFILLDKGNVGQDGKETTCLALVADETASLHFQLWGDECHVFEAGDIIRLTNGIFSYHKSNLVLRAGKKGKAEKVGEFNMLFVETPNMSEIKWAIDPGNPRKFVQEAVVSPHSRIFPPLP